MLAGGSTLRRLAYGGGGGGSCVRVEGCDDGAGWCFERQAAVGGPVSMRLLPIRR